MPKIILEKLYPDAKVPTRATDGAAGYDVCAYLDPTRSIKVYGLPEFALNRAIEDHAQRMSRDTLQRLADRLNGASSTASTPAFYFNEGDTQFDRFPYGNAIEILPGHRALIPTGLKMAIPPGWEVQVRPRSGAALKTGVTVLNSPGTLDSDYRGEIGIILINTSRSLFELRHGDRIAQLVALPTFEMRFEEGPVVADSDRGEGGFGSTGTA